MEENSFDGPALLFGVKVRPVFCFLLVLIENKLSVQSVLVHQ